jgi:peptidoglycan/LPS O-acetylase OafA/YrhL
LYSTPKADAATSFLLIPIDVLLLQSWYPNLWAFWHHAGTWSISVEFFLYAAFPVLLALNRLTSRELIAACCASTLLASSWIPSLGVGASSDLPFPVFYSVPIYSLPIFVVGVALSELHRRGFRGSMMAPVLLFAILAFAGHRNTRHAGLNFIMLPLIALTLLFAARGAGNIISRLLVNRLTVYLGDISYGVFVYQIPLLLALDHYIYMSRILPAWQLAGAMLLCNIGLAAISHRWIEPWGRRLVVKHWGAGGRDELSHEANRPATGAGDETNAQARASR